MKPPSARSEGQRLRWARVAVRGELSADEYAELRALLVAQHDVIARIDALCARTKLSRAALFRITPPKTTEGEPT